MRKALAILTLLVSTTFFSYGCTAAQRKELLMEGLEATKEYVKTDVLPALAKKIEDKLAEQEVKQLSILDAQLAKVAKTDPETGVQRKKTWKDFDADTDGHLSPGELASLTAYVAKESAGLPGGGDTTKATASAAGILGLLWLGMKGAQKLRNGKKPAAPAGGTA